MFSAFDVAGEVFEHDARSIRDVDVAETDDFFSRFCFGVITCRWGGDGCRWLLCFLALFAFLYLGLSRVRSRICLFSTWITPVDEGGDFQWAANHQDERNELGELLKHCCEDSTAVGV